MGITSRRLNDIEILLRIEVEIATREYEYASAEYQEMCNRGTAEISEVAKAERKREQAAARLGQALSRFKSFLYNEDVPDSF